MRPTSKFALAATNSVVPANYFHFQSISGQCNMNFLIFILLLFYVKRTQSVGDSDSSFQSYADPFTNYNVIDQSSGPDIGVGPTGNAHVSRLPVKNIRQRSTTIPQYARCGNFRIFPSLRFYVKSNLKNVKVLKLPFLLF